MTADFGNPALVHNDNHIAIADKRKPVSNKYRCSALFDTIEVIKECSFRLVIKG